MRPTLISAFCTSVLLSTVVAKPSRNAFSGFNPLAAPARPKFDKRGPTPSTNAERFALGLPPAAPRKRSTRSSGAHRPRASPGPSTEYTLEDNYSGQNLLDNFTFETFADPTHGRVTYVSEDQGKAAGIVVVDGDTLTLGVDSTAVLPANGPGRQSVRIKSNKAYTTGVIILDASHMPQGCTTWPAFWTTNDVTWPVDGEIDIIEGVNDQAPNASTLHTTGGCTMNYANSGETGNPVSGDCNVADNGNQGCSVRNNKLNNYGPAFNAAGGGWYAMERTDTYINVWFWSRNDPSVPAEVANGAATVHTGTWGTPYVNFVNNDCDFSTHFGPENIIINTTLCGDWAGNVYTGCPSGSFSNGSGMGACVDYVNNNPGGFVDAYWEINAVRTYA